MFKNFNFASILSIIIIGLFAGVIFVYANWTAPLSSPPTCNAGDLGCDAPLNVGFIDQVKAGNLVISKSLGIDGVLDVLSVSFFRSNLNVTGDIIANGDICTNLAGGKCLSTISGGGGGGSTNWSSVIGKPADFADDIDNIGIASETDPQVGIISTNYVPKWDGTALITGAIQDDGTNIGIGTAPVSNYGLSIDNKVNGIISKSSSGGIGIWGVGTGNGYGIYGSSGTGYDFYGVGPRSYFGGNIEVGGNTVLRGNIHHLGNPSANTADIYVNGKLNVLEDLKIKNIMVNGVQGYIITGGGSQASGCNSWGNAICSNGNFSCPVGFTRRTTGGGVTLFYICTYP